MTNITVTTLKWVPDFARGYVCDPALARESLDHLDRYIRRLFHVAGEDS